jgi:hypothetical protein
MGKRFLNNKTKEVFLGDNSQDKINDILQNYLPYQKVLIVTSASFIKENNTYYNNLLHSIKSTNTEYIYNEEVQVNKQQISMLLKNTSEDVACIIVLGNYNLINLVKVVSYIKSIAYIVTPTTSFDPYYLCNFAKVEVEDVVKFYKTNPPLAVILEKQLVLNMKKTQVLDCFCGLVTVANLILDEYLVNVCNAKTLFSSHFSAIKSLMNNTLKLDNLLYNYKNSAVLSLVNNSLKVGLILQDLNSKNIDSATLSAEAIKTINQNKTMPLSYYKVINSLFLTNLYKSFIKNLKASNYSFINIKNRINTANKYYYSKSLKTNLLQNINSINNLKLSVYNIKEYQCEMLEEINNINNIMLKAYTIFKRMNLQLSFYIENSLNTNNIKKAICLAPDLSTSNNFLKIMSGFGVLDYNF